MFPRTGAVSAALLACLSLAPAVRVTAQEGARKSARTDVRVAVDPRVELMSILFRLAGNPEYNRGRVGSYAEAVDAHFGKFKDHEAVQAAKVLRQLRGISYDAVMSMAVHIKDTKSFAVAVPFQPRPESLESRWPTTGALTFLRKVKAFAAESGFDGFMRSHEELFAKAAQRMQKVLSEDAGLDWFDRFFGVRRQARFELLLGMLNGPCCYAARLSRAEGKEDLYCVLGVWNTDSEGLPRFDASMLPTVVHEFCHSYCNPLVDRHLASLEAAATKIYSGVAEIMTEQAYGHWKTMMCESLVRACVVRYRNTKEGPGAARTEAAAQHRRGFRWTGELAALLGEYEADREKYPTLDAFMPRVAEFFDGYASRAAAEAQAAPRVVRIVPANGAADVDPGTTEIKVTFDRPMRDKAWAFVRTGPEYPETTGSPSYDEKRTTVTLPVKLEPDSRYELWLNRGQFSAFQSAEGVKLEPVRVTFRTGAKRK